MSSVVCSCGREVELIACEDVIAWCLCGNAFTSTGETIPSAYLPSLCEVEEEDDLPSFEKGSMIELKRVLHCASCLTPLTCPPCADYLQCPCGVVLTIYNEVVEPEALAKCRRCLRVVVAPIRSTKFFCPCGFVLRGYHPPLSRIRLKNEIEMI